VWFDSKLTFETHTNHITQSLRSLLGMFWRNLSPIRGTQAIKNVYWALAQSIIDYGLPIWGIAADSHLAPIEAAHRKFLRFIMDISPNDHSLSYIQLTQSANVQMLKTRFKYLTLNLIHRILKYHHTLTSVNLSALPSRRHTRNQDAFYLPFYRLDLTRRSHLYITPNLLNQTGSHIDIFTSPIEVFKSRLKTYLLLHP